MLRLLALLVFAASTLAAQSGASELPSGRELVAVYIGASTCDPCLSAEVKAALGKMKPLLSTWAQAHGYALSVVGVSTDWSTEKGTAFLSSSGTFDQLVIGGNWTNLGAERYLWSDSTAVPAMPQVILLERTVTLGNRISFSSPRVLRRISGAVEIPAWIAQGAPVPLAPAK